MQVDRRTTLAGLLAGLAMPAAAARSAVVNVTLLGQALLEHDLRAQNWPAGRAIRETLAGADVVFSNLETVIARPGTELGQPTRALETLHSGGPEVLECLRDFHISLLATANNHAYDLGTAGVLSTLAELDAAKLAHAGTGRTLAAAAAPGFTPDGRVGLVAWATGKVRDGGAATATRAGVNEVREDAPGRLNEDDVARVLTAIGTAAKRSKVVIAYHHNHLWGDDMAVTPAWQRDLAKRCVDAGAHVYVAHGAPLLHGVELYRDAPLFYGLGNFIFQTETPPGRYPARAWDGLIVAGQFAGGRPALTFRPIVLNERGVGGPDDRATVGRPALATGPDARRILRDFADRSRAFGTTIRIAGDRATLD